MIQAQLAFKQNVDEILVGLFHITPKTQPWLIKIISTTILDYVLTISSNIVLAKVDLNTCATHFKLST